MDSSPTMSGLNIEQVASAPLPHSATLNPELYEVKSLNVKEHELIHEGAKAKRFGRKDKRATHASIHTSHLWELARKPYHNYVHSLVRAGWDDLTEFDSYMSTAPKKIEQPLIISVLDITEDLQCKRWPDIHDELSLDSFLHEGSRDGVEVRLYMVEQEGGFSASIMEAFGSSLRLDPRFFQEIITGNESSLTPSQRHRAPFITIRVTIPKEWNSPNNPGHCAVSIYIKPDEVGTGWTGWFYLLTTTPLIGLKGSYSSILA